MTDRPDDASSLQCACGQGADTNWRFCPWCGQPLPCRVLPDPASLAELADADLQELLRRMDRVDLARALADPAWAPLKARMLANLPTGACRLLEDEWAYLRPDDDATRRAQASLLELAASLEELGVITLPKPGEVWVSAGEAAHWDAALEAHLTTLGEEAIQSLLTRIDKKTLTWCLFAASPALRQVFYDQITDRAVALLEEEIAFHGRLPLRDIEAARTELRALMEQAL